jgi:hypothetical protein
MDAEDLRARFGPEYPTALRHDGVRHALQREGLFARHYHADASAVMVSRFMDGSATINLDQLRREWPRWCADDRRDFCTGCGWLHAQPDFREMLRYLLDHGDASEVNAIAQVVGTHLPSDEAFERLCAALAVTNTHTANLLQGIAATKHPRAQLTLSVHLDQLWVAPGLWEADAFLNWTAFDALCCIQYLLDLGVAPSSLEERVRQLIAHPCEQNRQSCVSFLRTYYTWLPP